MATDYRGEAADTYLEGLTLLERCVPPIVEELVQPYLPFDGKTVIEFGYGGGKFSLFFAEHGARVRGIEISEDMQQYALEHASHPNITYYIGDASTDTRLHRNTGDLGFMNMVVPGVPDNETLTGIFRNMARILKPGRPFLFSALHPLYIADHAGPDVVTEFDPTRYFEDGYVFPASATTEEGNTMEFSETHFGLEALSRCLEKAGMHITRMREPRPMEGVEPHFPKFIFYEART